MAKTYLGIDVGGKRKGFNIAIVSGSWPLDVDDVQRKLSVSDVEDLVADVSPTLTAIDCPIDYARAGETRRDAEKDFAEMKICGIRWTPSLDAMNSNPSYYEWIIEGRKLVEALSGTRIIEVFPTASWTQWVGPREGSRARWTRDAIESLGLTEGFVRCVGVCRPNQDDRDALAAAINAWQAATIRKSQHVLGAHLHVPVQGRPDPVI